MNRYVYAKSNPLKYYDPSGHFPLITAFLFCGSLLFAGINAYEEYERGGDVDQVIDAFVDGGIKGLGYTALAISGAEVVGYVVYDVLDIGSKTPPAKNGAGFKEAGRYNNSAGIKGGNYSNINEGLNFSSKAAEHMGESARQVPVQTLQDVIKQGNAFPDPRGSRATMYYSQMYINEKMYNIEVLYDEVTNTVYHFEYARKAMGNLPAIKK